jgi:hypothetical protein
MASFERLPKAVQYLALARVEELLLAGYSLDKIVAQMSAEGISESRDQILSWTRAIYRKWTEEDKERRPYYRELWSQRLEARYRMMLEDLANPTMKMTGHARAAMYDSLAKVELLAMKMHGLDAPIKHEHSGTIDVRALTPEERRKRIDELLEKRKQTLALPAPSEESVH